MVDFLEYSDTLWMLEAYSPKRPVANSADQALLKKPLCNGLNIRYNTEMEAVLIFNWYEINEENLSIRSASTRVSSQIVQVVENGRNLIVETLTATYAFNQLVETFDDLFNSEDEENDGFDD